MILGGAVEVCGSGSLDAATNLIGVTNQSLSCPSFCHGGQGRAQAVLKQCLAAAAAARERCRTISSRWTLGVSCLPCDPPYEGIVFSPISVENIHPCMASPSMASTGEELGPAAAYSAQVAAWLHQVLLGLPGWNTGYRIQIS